MGILDRIKGLFGRKEEEEQRPQEKYVLKKQSPRGGWKKIAEFDHFVTPEEVIDDLPPGIYRLDVHREGKRGFEVAWGPIAAYDTEEDLEELGVEEEEPRRRKKNKKDSFSALDDLIEELDRQAEVMQKLGEVGLKLARFSGQPVVMLEPGKTYEDVIVEGLMKMRQKYEELDKIFGTSKLKGSEAELPIDGKIPAWAVYAPKLLTQMLDNIEMRLYKWGLLGEMEGVQQPRPSNVERRASDFPDINRYKQKYEKQEWKHEERVETYRPQAERRTVRLIAPEPIEEPQETRVEMEKKEKIVDEGNLQVDEVDIKEVPEEIKDKSIKELMEEVDYVEDAPDE